MPINESFVEELRYRNDIQSVVSAYVDVKRRGRTWVGLCPFHSEKTPSFALYPESNSFYCFGCGAGGDVITFVRRIENLDYIEALRFLAKRVGMELPEDEATGAGVKKRRILEMNRIAARHYFDNLMAEEGRPAREYLLGRGLKPATIRRFGIGFAKESWDDLRDHLRAKGFSYEEMATASLAAVSRKQSYFDQFRNRVIFPILDLRGDVVGFGGRDFGDRGPKYLNSSDTPVFHKSRNLFALNFAKSSGERRMMLAEGYMDVVALHQAGFINAVATLGTALTGDQARLLKQYADEVVICYDSDEAGQRATRRAIRLLDEVGLKTRVLEMKDAKDPDEYLKKFGAERFSLLLSGSANALEFQILKLREGKDLAKTSDRAAFLTEASALLAGLQSAVERDMYAGRLAEEFGVSKEALREQIQTEMKKTRRKAEKKADRLLRPGTEPVAGQRPDLERLQNPKRVMTEELLLGLCVKNPELLPMIGEKLSPDELFVPFNGKLYSILLKRAKDHLPVDAGGLSSELSTDEMGRYMRIVLQADELRMDMAQAEEYIGLIKRDGQSKTSGEIAELNPDEFGDYMRDISLRKKRGNVQ